MNTHANMFSLSLSLSHTHTHTHTHIHTYACIVFIDCVVLLICAQFSSILEKCSFTRCIDLSMSTFGNKHLLTEAEQSFVVICA